MIDPSDKNEEKGEGRREIERRKKEEGSTVKNWETTGTKEPPGFTVSRLVKVRFAPSPPTAVGGEGWGEGEALGKPERISSGCAAPSPNPLPRTRSGERA